MFGILLNKAKNVLFQDMQFVYWLLRVVVILAYIATLLSSCSHL